MARSPSVALEFVATLCLVFFKSFPWVTSDWLKTPSYLDKGSSPHGWERERYYPSWVVEIVLEGCNPAGFSVLPGRQSFHVGSHFNCRKYFPPGRTEILAGSSPLCIGQTSILLSYHLLLFACSPYILKKKVDFFLCKTFMNCSVFCFTRMKSYCRLIFLY